MGNVGRSLIVKGLHYFDVGALVGTSFIMRMTSAQYEAFLARREAASVKVDDQLRTNLCGAAREAKLRADVIRYCRERGWLVFSGTTASATGRTVGEPDLCICAELGLTYFVELKSVTGKLRPEQAAVGAWLKKLGHKWLLIRSLEEFVRATAVGNEN